MKYDYFERDGAACLYRVPTGYQTPVQVALGASWEQSETYPTRDELLGDQEVAVKQIDIVRALELAGAAPVDGGGYQYYEKDGGMVVLYRTPSGSDSPVECFGGTSWEKSMYGRLSEAPYKFSRITEARARQLEPSAFPSPTPTPTPTATRYFWWETSCPVSPYLLRVNPDSSVDYYAEADNRHEFTGWTSGNNAYTVDYLCACDSVVEISESTARSRRPAAFNAPQPLAAFNAPLPPARYFTNGHDLYRLTGTDTFHFWSFVNRAWSAPVTLGSVIVGYKEVTAQQAKDFMPKAEIAGATAAVRLIADFSVPGTSTTVYSKAEFVDGKLHISVYEIQ